MAKPKKPKTLAEKIAELDDPAPNGKYAGFSLTCAENLLQQILIWKR